MLRALENDPTTAVLKIASTPGGDFFFVPDGDVLYYLGLAAEAEGRDGDAEAAFREFIAVAPRSRWAHAAEAHVAKKPRAPTAGAGSGAGVAAPRIIAYGTVLATGGLAAPLVDAAWRNQLPILDECLAELRMPAHATVRIAIEIEVDVQGKATRVVAKVPAPYDERFGRCVESAAKTRLRLSVARSARLSMARTEMVVGVP
jgi:hypothetical protein